MILEDKNLPEGLALALNQVTDWRLRGKHLIVQLAGEIFKDVLQKNVGYLLSWFEDRNIDLDTLEIEGRTIQEIPMEDWEEQRRVWLDVFRGQEVSAPSFLGEKHE